MKFFLYTKFDCSIFFENKLIHLKKNTPFEVEEKSVLVLFPFCENYLSQTIIIEIEKLTQCKNAKIIFLPTYTIIEIYPNEKFTLQYFKTKQLKNGIIASLISFPTTIMVETKGKIFKYETNKKFENVEITENENLVLFEQTENFFCCICFHKTSHQFFEFNGNVNINANALTILADQNTYAKHGKLQVFNISSTNLELVSSEPVYLNKKPSSVPPFLIHIAFFEAIKEEDYELAKSYLTTEFSAKLNSEHFKKFFGEFSQIRNLVENNEYKIAILKKENTNILRARVFSFKINNNKICDIVED